MLVFIHINKTAGRTVRYILRSSYGMRHCEVEARKVGTAVAIFSNDDLRLVRKLYPGLASIAGHCVRGYPNLHENGATSRYFTFMRDPLKTCASRFQYNVQYRGKHDLIFEEWIRQEWTRNHQTKMIAGSADAGEAIRIIQQKGIFVGLTERFDESLIMLKAQLASDLNIAYKRVNVARDKSLASRLLSDSTSRQLLVEANRADLELYDFVRSEVYPAFQTAYGPTLATDVARFRQRQVGDFNNVNLTLSRLKQYMLYRPVLRLRNAT